MRSANTSYRITETAGLVAINDFEASQIFHPVSLLDQTENSSEKSRPAKIPAVIQFP
jgi:hypothetical protein